MEKYVIAGDHAVFNLIPKQHLKILSILLPSCFTSQVYTVWCKTRKEYDEARRIPNVKAVFKPDCTLPQGYLPAVEVFKQFLVTSRKTVKQRGHCEVLCNLYSCGKNKEINKIIRKLN